MSSSASITGRSLVGRVLAAAQSGRVRRIRADMRARFRRTSRIWSERPNGQVILDYSRSNLGASMAREWSIRLWVRCAAFAGALVCALASSAVFLEGFSSSSPADFILGVLTATGALGLAWLGWRPLIKVHVDGTVYLRGCFSSRRTTITKITAMYMTGFGLRFEIADAQPFTSVVFQATAFRRYPRFVEAVHAITGRWPADVPHP
ncbi:MAG: hypothetical protein JWQ12_190 [Glaciihabitans sp.]|nr:hypothetical protein [Glaciihabitans sp.]